MSEIVSPVTAATDENFPYLLYESKSCQLVVDDYTTVVRAKEGLATTAQVFKILGKMFIFGGETVAKMPKIAVGFTEFLGLQLELDGNFQKSLGNFLDGLADAADSRASSYEAMIDSCARLRAQLNILDNQQIIIAQMNDIQMSVASAGASTTVASSDDSTSSGAGAIALEIFLFFLLLAVLYRRQFRPQIAQADSIDKL